MKKSQYSQYKKIVKTSQKAKKRLSLKSKSKQKNQRPPELRTLVTNQDHSSPSKLGRPLLNWDKYLLRLQY